MDISTRALTWCGGTFFVLLKTGNIISQSFNYEGNFYYHVKKQMQTMNLKWLSHFLSWKISNRKLERLVKWKTTDSAPKLYSFCLQICFSFLFRFEDLVSLSLPTHFLCSWRLHLKLHASVANIFSEYPLTWSQFFKKINHNPILPNNQSILKLLKNIFHRYVMGFCSLN